ncbi:MAG: hypothetical protein AB8B60_04190 [Sulfitobacter sp.]
MILASVDPKLAACFHKWGRNQMSLEAQVKKLQKTVQQLERSHSQVTGTIKTVQKRSDEHSTALKTNSSRLDKVIVETGNCSTECQRRSDDLDRNHKELKKKLDAAFKKINADIRGANRAHNVVRDRLDALERDTSDIQSQLAASKKQTADFDRKIDLVNKRLDTAMKEINGVIAQAERGRVDIERRVTALERGGR